LWYTKYIDYLLSIKNESNSQSCHVSNDDENKVLKLGIVFYKKPE